jgi:predicted transcriptional regulator
MKEQPDKKILVDDKPLTSKDFEELKSHDDQETLNESNYQLHLHPEPEQPLTLEEAEVESRFNPLDAEEEQFFEENLGIGEEQNNEDNEVYENEIFPQEQESDKETIKPPEPVMTKQEMLSEIEKMKREYALRHNWISDITNEITKELPNSDYHWVEAQAITHFGMMFHDTLRFEDQIGKLRPIFVFIGEGSSGTVKDQPEKEYYRPLRQTLAERGYNFFLPSHFTKEAMGKYLTTKKAYGLIYLQEFTTVAKDSTGNGYNRALLEFLLTLFEGRVQSRLIIGSKDKDDKGKTIPFEETDGKDVDVSFLSSTTEYVYKCLDKESWFLSGHGRRVLWIRIPSGKNKDIDSGFFLPKSLREKEIHSYAERLLKLKEVTQEIPIAVRVFGKQAQHMLVDFANTMSHERDLFVKNKDYIRAAVWSMWAELCYKYLMVICLAVNEQRLLKIKVTQDGNPDESDAETNRIIHSGILPDVKTIGLLASQTEIEWTINHVKLNMEDFEQIITEWSTNVMSNIVKTDEAEINRILSLLRANNGRMHKTELLRASKLVADKFYRLIETLKEQDMISEDPDRDWKKAGTKPMIYSIKNFSPTSQQPIRQVSDEEKAKAQQLNDMEVTQ